MRTGDAGLIALALAFMTYSAAVIIFRYRETQRDGTLGMTTVVAAILTFALGAFAGCTIGSSASLGSNCGRRSC